MDTDELARQARALIDRDQKIEAIKLVRETTGWGLRESRDYVDALARAALPALGATGKAALEQEARALIGQDKYVEAIRRVRERTGWGLRESKDYVDALGAERGETHLRRAAASGLAQFPPPSRIGRNDPCPCGSGRKYKHCCGKKR